MKIHGVYFDGNLIIETIIFKSRMILFNLPVFFCFTIVIIATKRRRNDLAAAI